MHHLIEITQIKKIKLKIIEISIVNICWMVINNIFDNDFKLLQFW